MIKRFSIVCSPLLPHRTAIVLCAGFLLSTAAWGKSAKIYPHSPCHPKNRWPGCAKKFHGTQLKPYTPKQFKDHGVEDKLTPLGRTARGFWITPYYMHRVGAEKIAKMMKRNHLNAVVLDTKDDLGRVLWPSKVALSQQVQNHLLPDPKQMLATFHNNGIYVIARMVTFKDSRLPYVRPDLSARIGPRARRLLSAGANWLDPYAMEVQDYIIELTLELEELGFDEIQFDYIRFPKGLVSRIGTWLHNTDNTNRATLIRGFLERVDRALRIPISVDVYGLTTLVDGDPRQLGQSIEGMAKHVDAISPMMYANGMDTYFKNNKVTEHVYNLINCGLWRARKKAPNIALRPYLQAYPNNVEHFFGVDFIARQLDAAERAGSDGFLFWNPGMRNGVVWGGLKRFRHTRVDTFGQNTSQWKENEPGQWCKRKGAVFTKKRKKDGK